MEIHEVKISKVKLNPNNPRIIRDDKFQKLVKSIQDFPEMLRIRPVVVNEDWITLGGNMRLKAAKEAGLKTIPVIQASELSKEQQREFIIKDNVGFGEWDWQLLKTEWDDNELSEWGLDKPSWQIGHEANMLDENDLDLNEEFDPIGISKGLQRVVFIFDGKDEAESWLSQHPTLPIKKMNGAWQVNLSTQYT